MKNRILKPFLFIAGLSLMTSLSVVQANKAERKRADNAAVNQRDKDGAELTAGHQSNSKNDMEITRLIRRELVNDKTLSTYAHNVKVITLGGDVTLRGPVRSHKERVIIERAATKVAGAHRVTNQIDVVP